MRIIISPAKKMQVDEDSLAPEALPGFLTETEQLLSALRALSAGQLQALWKCNDALAKLNVERVEKMELSAHLTPAILSYEGIQYQYMAPGVMERAQLDYLREHLRILSGFYGVLRPFDGVTPYRLEMQARLAVGECRDLYGFWSGKLAQTLAGETDCIINLASKEYSRAVKPHLPDACRFLTCTFAEWKNDKLVEKGTACKMARGQMVRWMAEQNVSDPEQLREFRELDYQYSPEHSAEHEFVFIKGGT